MAAHNAYVGYQSTVEKETSGNVIRNDFRERRREERADTVGSKCTGRGIVRQSPNCTHFQLKKKVEKKEEKKTKTSRKFKENFHRLNYLANADATNQKTSGDTAVGSRNKN